MILSKTEFDHHHFFSAKTADHQRLVLDSLRCVSHDGTLTGTEERYTLTVRLR
jgi:hypothetical protein